MNTAEWVRRCLIRDLATLQEELALYDDDQQVWHIPVGAVNSAGTLVVHCCGNLRHFVGQVLGQSGYIRDRDNEFAVRDLPRANLLQLIAETVDDINHVLDNFSSKRLNDPFPILFASVQLSVGQALIHLATHLAYHLGQVDGHRRTVTGVAKPVGAVSLPPLVDQP
jgi:hypothetical protein